MSDTNEDRAGMKRRLGMSFWTEWHHRWDMDLFRLSWEYGQTVNGYADITLCLFGFVARLATWKHDDALEVKP